jgi:hypothetical protein
MTLNLSHDYVRSAFEQQFEHGVRLVFRPGALDHGPAADIAQ